MKRKTIFLTFVVITVSLTGGCVPFGDGGPFGSSRAQASKLAALERSIKPVPEVIAGTWQEMGEDAAWRIVIEPNGIVSSAVIRLMTAGVRPYQTTKVEMLDGSFSTFTGGDMFAEYNPINRELFVFIEVREFRVRFYDVRTGGSSVDRFTGTVSEDGKVWKPSCVTAFDLGPELPMDVNDIEPIELIFDKVEQ